ncbi:MAG: polyprenyl synthetase family protein, partial [Gammaproteobacteria bacterium]|nr:polyprenyl synthetase family protein [Gammaproteobacteria bacterium]
ASEDVVEAMTRYGRNLGIAFQIADDLLDLMGDSEITGKSLGTDLQKQKPTLPFIYIWKNAGEGERNEISAILTGPIEQRRTGLSPWFDRYGAFDYARDRAQTYASNAIVELQRLAPSPSREVLEQIANFVVARSQ